MDKYYVVVAGTGPTSRANVEALVDDYVYAHGPDVTVILAYEQEPSPGQVFISQWAKDKNKDIIIFAKPGAKFDGLASSSFVEAETPLLDACKFVGKNHATGFILWDKDEPDSALLSTLEEFAIPPYNLTEGLTTISEVTEPQENEVEEEPEEPAPDPMRAIIEEEVRKAVREYLQDSLQSPLKGPQA